MSTPLDAASIILLSRDRKKVLWARRNPELRFLGGFHSFAGGKLEESDRRCEVRNESDPARRQLIACAVRETFEEIGVLIARNGEKLTAGQRRSLHDDLVSGREEFADILSFWGLWIDAGDLVYTGEWTTPEFSPIRFRTRFFAAICPPKQVPYRAITELGSIEYILPSEAVARWARSEVLITPPVLFSLQQLESASTSEIEVDKAAATLRAMSDETGGHLDHMRLNPRLISLPLRTKTLPPATHTNCFIQGVRRFLVIDPAARDSVEQAKLRNLVDSMVRAGGECAGIVVSHLHGDHVGGETDLKRYLLSEYGRDVPLITHKETAEALDGSVEFDRLEDGDHTYTLQDASGDEFTVDALHTPGHARGHLCFYDRGMGFLLSMDNVLAAGSVLIDPPEGNMTDYLESLERMMELPGLRFLCGSHGPAVHDAKGKIREYIDHRLERERQVIEALKKGLVSAEEIAAELYMDLPQEMMPLAARSVTAHLERLRENPELIEE